MASGKDDFTEGKTNSEIKSQLPRVARRQLAESRLAPGLAAPCSTFPLPHCRSLVGSVLALSHIYVLEIGNNPKAQECVMVYHFLKINAAKLPKTI